MISIEEYSLLVLMMDLMEFKILSWGETQIASLFSGLLLS